MKKDKDQQQALENLKALEEAKLISRRDFLTLSSQLSSGVVLLNFLTPDRAFAWVATRMRKGKGTIAALDTDVGDIGHSLRFRSAASAFLSKSYIGGTSPADTSIYKKHFHFFVKRAGLGSTQVIVSNYYNGSNFWNIYFNSSDQLAIYTVEAGVVIVEKTTTAVFRDISAHYCIDVIVDTSVATAEDRVQFWLNGKRITAWASNTNPAQNSYVSFLAPISGTWYSRIGLRADNAYPLDGYISRFVVLDGVNGSTPASLGYLNTNTNGWVTKSQSAVKAVVDASGTNSFMLDFDNGTSAATLGYDKSSKAHNWTLNNFNLTVGNTYDWSIDSPSNNFATWSSIHKSPTMTLNSASSHSYNSTTTNACVGASMALPSTGKWYWETYVWFGGGATSFPIMGIALESFAGFRLDGYYPGWTADSWGLYCNTGGFVNNNSVIATYSAIANGGLMMHAYDADSGKYWMGYNGTWFNSGNPVAGTGAVVSSGLAGKTIFPVVADYGGSSCVAEFGAAPTGPSSTWRSAAGGYFSYAPPTGFYALSTKNLSMPTIVNAKKHFDINTRTGNGGQNTVAGFNFQPDLVWTKSRNSAYNHALVDSVRGMGKMLAANLTAAESAADTTNGLFNFYNGGFSYGGANYCGANTATYVDWLWKAGGAAVSNTQGTITSQVSANTAAGFSIVTYTGTGSASTVGHGLSNIPKFIIVKNRTGSADHWPTWHQNLAGMGYAVRLNLSNAQATSGGTGWWNNTAATSSVFSIGPSASGSAETNTSGNTYVAYCFAEISGYSKFGSYSANGSVDGPFVFCGFKPRYVMIKRIDSTGDWFIYDSARAVNNTSTVTLAAANVSSEASFASTNYFDILSNGFKIRHDGGIGYNNTAGATYIFIAFAEAPFKYANAR